MKLEKLEAICKERMARLGLSGVSYEDRLKEELKEIASKNDAGYFLDLYDSKKRFAKNDHNLAVAFLLGLVDYVDWSKGPEYTVPEFPDIDVDYIPQVRDYLKTRFAPEVFGEEFCCNISNYNTYGLKSALIDMARVFGESRDEILRITTELGLKDDEGQVLSWEKALEIYPSLKEWVEKHWWATDAEGNQMPGPAQCAKNLLYADIDWHSFDYKGEPPHRCKSMGMHAGGLIISSKKIDELVPLVRGKDGVRASAWSEGLHSQDLSQVGLVKYDFLVIDALTKIANCVKLVCERHDIDRICAVPGGSHFSDDDALLSDKKCISTANAGDLKLIFQFDSDGIRELAKKGGVTSFDDIVAYTSLYRPGPMDVKMHDEYCLRKKFAMGQEGGKEYKLHPLMEELIGRSYGVMCVDGKTRVRQENGTEKLAKDVRKGDRIVCVDEGTGEIHVRDCHGAGPTRFCKGVRVRLKNGYEVDVTADHKILTARGMVEAAELLEGRDLVVCPRKCPQTESDEKFAEIFGWLGNLHDVAYLIGQMIGDGSLTASVRIATGTKKSHDAVYKWTAGRFPGMRFTENFYGRSWYLDVAGEEIVSEKGHGNRKTKFGLAMDRSGLRSNCCYKRIPQYLLTASKKCKASLLAGLLESDGCLGVDKSTPIQAAFYTSTSHDLLQDVRCLCQSLGIECRLRTNRLYFLNIKKLKDVVGQYLVFKAIDGILPDGSHAARVSFDEFDSLRNDLSIRSFCESVSINRRNYHLAKKRGWVSASLFARAGGNLAEDIWYSEVESVQEIEERQFYGLSVDQHHNFVANGMFVSNCYQEDVMKVLNRVGNIPLEECQPVIKAISKKNKAKIQKFQEMFVVNAPRTLGLTTEEATDLWNQIESFAGYGFNQGHGTAYSKLSWIMLYLKCHYPIEFYASSMSALGTADERLLEYKRDAEKHGIKVEPLDINISKQEFAIIGPNYPKAHPSDKIYWALGKIKGIGEESAALLEQNQPYADLKDFLTKFGTHGIIAKPVIALQCFKERSALDQYRFYVSFKDQDKKKGDRDKRFAKTMEKHRLGLKELLQGVDPYEVGWQEATIRATELGVYDEFETLKKKHDKCSSNYEKKIGTTLELGDADLSDDYIPHDILEVMTDSEKAEVAFYGFLWRHPIEKCERYSGRTFEVYRDDIARGYTCCDAEVFIKVVKECKAKKGNNIYFQLEVEDANNEFGRVNVWKEDFAMFGEDLVEGNMVRLRLNPPSKGFKPYTFESFPKWKRPTHIDKNLDSRCVVLKRKGE